MNKKVKPRKSTEWHNIVLDYMCGNLSKIEYCRLNDIKLKFFYNWHSKHHRQIPKTKQPSKNPVQFIPAKIISLPSTSAYPAQVKIQLANGHSIRCASNINQTELMMIFKVCLSCG